MNLKEINWKKCLEKKYLITYAVVLAAVVFVVVLVVLLGCGNANDEPEETTLGDTTPAETTPAQTTPADIVTYPSDEESDPKREDIFFD